MYPYDVMSARQGEALSIKVHHPDWISRGEHNEIVVFVNEHHQYEFKIELVMLSERPPKGLLR